jgi:hypothetical protein
MWTEVIARRSVGTEFGRNKSQSANVNRVVELKSDSVISNLREIGLYFIIIEVNCEFINGVNKPVVVITVYQSAGNIVIVSYFEATAFSFNFFHLDMLRHRYHENSSSESWHLSLLLIGQHVQPWDIGSHISLSYYRKNLVNELRRTSKNLHPFLRRNLVTRLCQDGRSVWVWALKEERDRIYSI